MSPQEDEVVLKWAERVGRLVLGTDGWTTTKAWAVRRAIEAYVQREFGVKICHVAYKSPNGEAPGAGDSGIALAGGAGEPRPELWISWCLKSARAGRNSIRGSWSAVLSPSMASGMKSGCVRRAAAS